MDRVSIITLLGANNIGAFLQAFSLCKTLESLNKTATFLTAPGKSERVGKINKIIRYVKNGNYRMLFFKIRTGKKYNSARTYFNVECFDENNEYEYVIVGSDEMWNVTSRAFQQYPYYFGKGVKAKKLISYAPSAGNTLPEDIKSAEMDFSDFETISVRDEKTKFLVKEIDGRDPIKVLDPTFLIENYDSFIPEINVFSEYILVYSYGMSDDEIKMAKEFARKVKLPLYSVGTYNSWCKKNIIVSPFEFLAYLKKAKYVITSTFHGSALSINFNKEFVTCLSHSEKTKSLLMEFHL